MRAAKLRIPSACIEDLRCSPTRGLQRDFVRQLASGRWMDEHRSLLITGKTGTGKTYIACALGQHACRHGRRTSYRRLSLLLQDFMAARAVTWRFERVCSCPLVPGCSSLTAAS